MRACTIAVLSAAAIAAAIAGTALPAQADFQPFRLGLAEGVSADPAVASFYRARDYAPLWTDGSPASQARLSALVRAFEDVHLHGLSEADYDPEVLRARLTGQVSERDLGRLEADLTALFLAYAHDVQSGILDPASIIPDIKRDLQRRDAGAILQGLASAASPDAYIRSLPPRSGEYARLMRARLDLEEAVLRGGWGPRVDAERLEPGDTGPAVVALRNRLVAMGLMAPSPTAAYDAAITAAVQEVQVRNGLTPDGVAGEATLTEINVSAEDRLKSVLVAMERERWMNYDRGERHIWVNIPSFRMQMVYQGHVVFQTKSVVGRNEDGRRTPEFSDEMEHMVVNPTWHVPRSIAVADYLPRLQRNPGANGYLRITDRRGQPVDRASTDFTQYSVSNFPFDLKQPPGPGNALGVVKFMFPNPWNIYLHDTPDKHLFDREARAYSSGCIRLADPRDFARALLALQSDDPAGLFQATLETGRETQIDLTRRIPVHLDYRTSFTDAKGALHHRRDIYGRDARLWQALAEAGVELPGVQG
jgi:murein L,D-transpeptidase YcbB/YkuD